MTENIPGCSKFKIHHSKLNHGDRTEKYTGTTVGRDPLGSFAER
jgi:hypothetical protein